MATEFETAEAYAQAARNARRFQQEQTRASRQMEVDINSIARAFRGLRRAMTVGGVTGILTGAIKEAADFNDKLTRIGVNARLTEPLGRSVAGRGGPGEHRRGQGGRRVRSLAQGERPEHRRSAEIVHPHH